VLLGLYFTALQAYKYFETIYNCGFSIRINIFCGNRISRTTRNYRNIILNYMSTTTRNTALLIKSSLRIWSSSM